MLASSFTLVGTVFVCSFITNFWVFFALWGVVFSCSLSMFYWIPGTIGWEWFPNSKGLVNGVFQSIIALGAGIIPIIAKAVIDLPPLIPGVEKKDLPADEIKERNDKLQNNVPRMFLTLASIFALFLTIGTALISRPENTDPKEKAKRRESVVDSMIKIQKASAVSEDGVNKTNSVSIEQSSTILLVQ